MRNRMPGGDRQSFQIMQRIIDQILPIGFDDLIDLRDIQLEHDYMHWKQSRLTCRSFQFPPVWP